VLAILPSDKRVGIPVGIEQYANWDADFVLSTKKPYMVSKAIIFFTLLFARNNKYSFA